MKSSLLWLFVWIGLVIVGVLSWTGVILFAAWVVDVYQRYEIVRFSAYVMGAGLLLMWVIDQAAEIIGDARERRADR